MRQSIPRSSSTKRPNMQNSHANRGITFERLIENACDIYQIKKLAIIQKLPTDWKIIRNGAQITGAFPNKKSTVDFMGVLNPGMAIAFEAKETKAKSFPFKNIHEHQIEYLKSVRKMGGHAFVLINFVTVDQIYKIDIKTFLELYEGAVQSGRKSIALKDIEEKADKVPTLSGIPDFLNAL